MSVQPGPTEKRYAANGVTTIYAVPFLVIEAGDLKVYLNGVLQTSGYTQTGVGDPTSSITFTIAPLGDLYLVLEVPFQRLVDYQENGDFFSSTVNRDFDRIWQALKQLLTTTGRSPVLGVNDVDGLGWYQAKGNGLRNLHDPIDLQDAATRNWSEVYLGGLVGGIVGNPNLASNVGYITPRGALGLVQDMSNSTDPLKGAGYVARAIRHVNSLDEMRALAGQYDGEIVYLRGRASGIPLGNGHFKWLTASVATDDDGVTIGSAITGRWVRQVDNLEVIAGWFGVGAGGSDYTVALQNAINYASAAIGGATGIAVRLPRGTVGISATINIPNRVGLLGANGRGTIVKPLAGFVGIYMFSATNGASSMFASWCRDMHIDARGTNLTAVVYTTGWQETCGMKNCVIQADGTTSNGILYEVGAGGAAMWEVLDCEIFIDSTAATRNGIRVNQVSSVGGFVLIVRNTTMAGSATNQLTRGVYMVNDSLVADLLHVEYTGIGILAGVAGNLDVRSMTGSGNNVTTMVALPGGYLGAYSISSLLPNGATNSVVNNTTGVTISGRIGHLAGPAKAPVTLWSGTAASGSVSLTRAVQPEEMIMFGINSTYAGMQQVSMFVVRGTTYNLSFGANAAAVLALSADGASVTVNSITAGFALDRVQVRTPGYFGS